jgi:hypothetical protein
MNTKSLLITILMFALATPALTARAAEKKDASAKAAKVEAGPRKGRLLGTDKPRPEFFVEKDRTVSIMFFDDTKKAVPPAEQTVIVNAQKEGKTTRLEFQKRGDALVSTTALPEGEGYPIVVQVKARPDAKPQNFRLVLDLHTCKECQNPEYACICDHE